MFKVHCKACGLYLGRISQEFWMVEITCPVCEMGRFEAKQALGNPSEGEEEYMRWFSQIMQRQVEYYNAASFIRRVFDGRE